MINPDFPEMELRRSSTMPPLSGFVKKIGRGG